MTRFPSMSAQKRETSEGKKFRATFGEIERFGDRSLESRATSVPAWEIDGKNGFSEFFDMGKDAETEALHRLAGQSVMTWLPLTCEDARKGLVWRGTTIFHRHFRDAWRSQVVRVKQNEGDYVHKTVRFWKERGEQVYWKWKRAISGFDNWKTLKNISDHLE